MASEGRSEDEEKSDHLRNASDSLLEGSSNLSKATEHVYRWLNKWMKDHPFLKWIIGLPIAYYLTQIMLEIGGLFFRYFFGRLVPIQNDVSVATHPLPVGFSLNVLYLLWLISAFFAFRRFITLRKRIERLEDN